MVVGAQELDLPHARHSQNLQKMDAGLPFCSMPAQSSPPYTTTATHNHLRCQSKRFRLQPGQLTVLRHGEQPQGQGGCDALIALALTKGRGRTQARQYVWQGGCTVWGSLALN
jgi:hypothetical protein